MSKTKNIIWRVLFWIALIVFIASVGMLGFMAFTYWKADSDYANLASRGFMKVEDAKKVTNLADFSVDWSYLQSINKDVVGWIYIPNTRVNYPIVQGRDNDEYLHKGFSPDGSFGDRSGAIFLDTACASNFSSTNIVLYGHHMNDGSMFAVLSDELTTQEGFDSTRTVYIFTPEKNIRCETFAVIRTTGSDLLAQASFTTDADRISYIQDKMNRSLVKPPEGFPSPQSVTQMITLSTCDYDKNDGRAVVFARVAETVDPRTRTATSTTTDVIAMRDAL